MKHISPASRFIVLTADSQNHFPKFEAKYQRWKAATDTLLACIVKIRMEIQQYVSYLLVYLI